MNRRRIGSGISLVTIGVFALRFGLGLASAHSIPSSKFASPLPLPLLFLGAGATVALTAGWLALTERTPSAATRRMCVLRLPSSISMPFRLGARLVFFAGFAAALSIGIVGRQNQYQNFATVFTWPVWFHGVALLSILVGTLWPVLSPWRALYRVFVWLEGEELAVLGSYPERLGSWPALASYIVVIGILENLTYIPKKGPLLTTAVLAVYTLVMVAGSLLYGTEWFRRADPLGVLYRLFGRVASITITRRDDGGTDVALRPPWQGTLTPVRNTSLVLFAITAVYTVSFDGFTNTRTYQDLLVGVQNSLGTGPAISILLYAIGLSVFVVSFGLCSHLVERLGGGSTDQRPSEGSEVNTDGGYVVGSDERTRDSDWHGSARHFAPTVLPIAAAYEVAHNYPYVFRNLAQLATVAVHPLSPSAQTANPLAWLPVPVFWGSQVVLIVLGHVIAVVAAHYVAVERFETNAAARRGHLPLVALMVGYTVLSLWIISQPVVS
ncbi:MULTISPECIES: hypothetical protein [unclassified Haladaptatus]|uniref:hypothetical protein n=1 Tax=unclassified Haladaptatus TaxID=2622732 RepID=UPI00209BE12A|nr:MULTISPECIES: hypothetical protein [unclassified Haladaptatus]MCO8246403.1 hypothetical protein [Haladaptatus sp. AB643]MCO8255305.1 hypothetical protein [Haladaptatus sp. AB618]